MKKTIRRNLYAAVDVMAVVTLLLLVAAIAKREEAFWKCFFGSVIATGILGISQALFGKSKIENESGGIIYTKSEEGCDAVELDPGASRYDIDGVKNQGRTYKIVDGVHSVAKKDGTVKVKSFTGRVANYILGGGVLTTPPDECWRTLFNA